MEQGFSGPRHDDRGDRPSRAPLDNLRNERRKLPPSRCAGSKEPNCHPFSEKEGSCAILIVAGGDNHRSITTPSPTIPLPATISRDNYRPQAWSQDLILI